MFVLQVQTPMATTMGITRVNTPSLAPYSLTLWGLVAPKRAYISAGNFNQATKLVSNPFGLDR